MKILKLLSVASLTPLRLLLELADDFKMKVMCEFVAGYLLRMKDDMKGAHAAIDQLAKEYPNSEIAKNPGEYKASLKSNADRKKEMEERMREIEEKQRRFRENPFGEEAPGE